MDERVKPVILFDLDGTLIDSTEAILESFHHTFDRFKREHPSDEAIKAGIGHTLDDMYRSLGIEEEMVWEFVEAYRRYYRPISRIKTVLLPFASQAITIASSFARLGIVTTKTGKYSKELMEHFKIAHHFETIIGRENVTHPKPHAEPILTALSEMNASKKNACIIGDTFMDIESAINAGIEHIAVTSGYGTKASLSMKTSNIESNALEAVKLLQKRFST